MKFSLWIDDRRQPPLFMAQCSSGLLLWHDGQISEFCIGEHIYGRFKLEADDELIADPQSAYCRTANDVYELIRKHGHEVGEEVMSFSIFDAQRVRPGRE